MTDMAPKRIETPVRLSQSKLWMIQQNYFTTKGIEAWKDEVPFYISSNAFIGHRYALLVLNFIKDWRRQHPNSQQDCFYMLEIGSGMGLFSFYFLKFLKTLLSAHHLADQKFCYIITDLIENNVKFCLENPSFAPFVAAGEIDFACFNVDRDKDFHLLKKDQAFTTITQNQPLIVIANYTFDCIKQDAFFVKEQKCYEMKLGLRSRYKDFDISKSQHLKDLRLDYHVDEAINIVNYYDQPILNDILKEYAQTFQEKEAIFLLPVGAFEFLHHLNPSQLFMIVGDKGITEPHQMPLVDKHQISTFDGCFSFLVNFHALGSYLKKLGGDYLHSQHSNDFKINLYTKGIHFSELSATKACFETVVDSFGPDEYGAIYEEYLANSYRFSMRALLGFVRLSQWDPQSYAAVHERLIELIPSFGQQFVEDINQDLLKVKENIYHFNLGDDIFNLLGIFYQQNDDFDKALEVYEESMQLFPQKAASYHNAALIYEKQKNTPKAIEYYEKSYQIDKKNIFDQRKAKQLSGKPTVAMIYPILKGVLVILLIALVLYVLGR
ncbi:MAG: tetratricopeptide repeat protein [Candidatus Berkiellales bacterium]